MKLATRPSRARAMGRRGITNTSLPMNASECSIGIHLESRSLKFSHEMKSPPPSVQWNVDNAVDIGRQGNALFDERERAISTQFSNKESELKNYILSRSELLLLRICFRTSNVVGGENDHSTLHVRRVRFKLFDDRVALVRLFVQDDRFKI